MDDILSQGGDRGPSRWPHRLAVIGAPILVAAAAIVYLSLARHSHSPSPAPSASATSTGFTTTGPASVSLAAPGQPNGPDGIGGPALPWADSLRLPVTGSQPAWFSPATGRSESARLLAVWAGRK